jgi:hypothetical protein
MKTDTVEHLTKHKSKRKDWVTGDQKKGKSEVYLHENICWDYAINACFW